jgi:hypothetical protein
MMMAGLQAKDGKDGNRRLLVSALKGFLHNGHEHNVDDDTTNTNKRGLLHGGADDGDGSGVSAGTVLPSHQGCTAKPSSCVDRAKCMPTVLLLMPSNVWGLQDSSVST